MDFANTAVQKDIDNQNSGDKSKTGALDFNFDPDGKCSGDFETTGTKAIIFGPVDQNQGQTSDFVDIAHANDYCWTADLTPSFVLKAAKKEGAVLCNNPYYGPKFKSIGNNYVGFYMNKRTVSKKLGPDSQAAKDRNQSLSRCRVNGILEDAKCPGANE